MTSRTLLSGYLERQVRARDVASATGDLNGRWPSTPHDRGLRGRASSSAPAMFGARRCGPPPRDHVQWVTAHYHSDSGCAQGRQPVDVAQPHAVCVLITPTNVRQ
jgi:hypothetical protein